MDGNKTRRSLRKIQSVPKLISKKVFASILEIHVSLVLAIRNKFHFSGIAAVVTALRQWILGKSKAGVGGAGGLGLALEPEEQKEIGGSRIALLLLLASLTTLDLWAYGYDSDCKTLRDGFCAVADKRCRKENSLDGHWQSTRITGFGGTYYQA